ncbi:MAG: hypothetical protein OXT67_07550, partial [Zetaproteobacteria bacterium]|nr:hypothetical protein [Zetaproteobacteria bacterium]
YVEELFEQPRQSSQKAFAVITFPFLDSNKYTFQKIRTNMDAQLSQGHPRYPSLVSCDFEENLLKIPPHKLDSKQGAVLTRYAYQACLKAVACRFEGSRSEIDADLDAFQREFYFIAQPAHPKLNAFVPRAFLAAGGL